MKTLLPYEPHLQRFPRQNMAFFPLQLTTIYSKLLPQESSVGLMIQE